jgi:hypothetical protein
LRSPEPLRLHVADDDSYEDTYIYNLLDKAGSAWGVASSYTNAQRNGIGASLNLALERLERDDDLWMYITDDWLLTAPLDLSLAVWLLRERQRDYVRLGPIHPNLHCITCHHNGAWWLDLEQEFGGFAFATRPFLATRRFYREVGPFPENLDAYDTERIYAERVSRMYTISLSAINLHGPWRHIGDVEVGDIQPNAAK